jgi:hypothetical protein
METSLERPWLRVALIANCVPPFDFGFWILDCRRNASGVWRSESGVSPSVLSDGGEGRKTLVRLTNGLRTRRTSPAQSKIQNRQFQNETAGRKKGDRTARANPISNEQIAACRRRRAFICDPKQDRKPASRRLEPRRSSAPGGRRGLRHPECRTRERQIAPSRSASR